MPTTQTSFRDAGRILLVAGSRSRAQALRAALESAGFEVETVTDGRDGLHRARCGRFGAVVSEAAVPGIDGFELCRRLTADEALGAAPVVLLTAFDEPTAVMRALAVGATNFVSQPCDPEQLVARVRASLEARGDAPEAGRNQVVLMGREFTVSHGPDRILGFLLSALEDRVRTGRDLTPIGGELADEMSTAGGQADASGAPPVDGDEVQTSDSPRDALTGLPDRAVLLQALAAASARAEEEPNAVWGFLSLDLDRFRTVNDSLGQDAGDAVLAEIARRLRSSVRAGDVVARVGGDEFGILLEALPSPREGNRVAERIQEALSGPVSVAGQQVFVTASIGAAFSSAAHGQPDQVLRDAGTALYRAKRLGGASYEVFDGAVDGAAATRLRLETDLHLALERGELEVHYEPMMSLLTGQTSGFEALVRWRHPHRGIVFPGEFIPVAEETGLIAPIGRWVLLEACRQAQAWRQRFASSRDLTISVNVSGRQLDQDDLVGQVEEVLGETGLPSRLLHLEITESAVMRNPDVAAAVLARLRARGVRISIDDFGTGYCSLGYLHRLPCDVLKIDRSFVNRVGATRDGASIVRTIAALGRDLGLDVVAEGVETEEQAEELRALGCHFVQGFVRASEVRTAEALLDVECRLMSPVARAVGGEATAEGGAWWVRIGSRLAAPNASPEVRAGLGG